VWIQMPPDVESQLADGAQAKMVFNESGAIVFPVSVQHREVKGPGISYEDNYGGGCAGRDGEAGAD
jgi:hypothetical protein